eukprot:3726184-Pleurochrysis_carterae.AAC.2
MLPSNTSAVLKTAAWSHSSKRSCLHDRCRTQILHKAAYTAVVLLLRQVHCQQPLRDSNFSPFGFRYMQCFYDLATKYLKVYYLRNAIAAEVQSCFKTVFANNHRLLSGRAVTWLTDNGS